MYLVWHKHDGQHYWPSILTGPTHYAKLLGIVKAKRATGEVDVIRPKDWIPARHEFVFGHGAYVVTPVSPVMEYQDGKATGRQKVDEASGERVWEVTVLDADPDAKGSAKSVKVQIFTSVQPVPPSPQDGSPFALVEFEGLAVKPYVVHVMRDLYRVAFSVSARGFAST